jgi:hypothetical protein
MMYTPTPPDSRTDRTRLFFRADAIPSEQIPDHPVFEVAVRYDARTRRVEPLTSDHVELVAWTTPGEAHADGSVTARGTIPAMLYTGQLVGANGVDGPAPR